MTTFSQLIDKIVLETKRPDMLREFESFLNQTIREVHFEPERGNVAFLVPNYNEVQLTADSDNGFMWTIPYPQRFQGLAAVRFDSQFSNGKQVYAQQVSPGRTMQNHDNTYQRAGDRVIFRGYGGVNGVISLAYYEYPRAHKYYPVATRPASFDVDDGWTYHADWDADDATKLAAEERVSDWVLMRWFMVLEEGLRAKIYKRLSDDSRARTSYSLYLQQRRGLITSELADIGGPYYSA